ncbi:uncharacterized protein GGS25DRAFT_517371 [Hypoxylon fragiforme]|uniref:uncharacterized protein n=1 Tax=Hypoxylon fragiforme TaxID=63214 RepID=UPI0020C60703|nr:uncharacterized protein GGS25DRAFT_517371 [Hypoxylon fragiforme]KAI2614520.1 hypothetical protein GGS25DRAFT_517371 [Hypoxylon fragiforme]
MSCCGDFDDYAEIEQHQHQHKSAAPWPESESVGRRQQPRRMMDAHSNRTHGWPAPYGAQDQHRGPRVPPRRSPRNDYELNRAAVGLPGSDFLNYYGPSRVQQSQRALPIYHPSHQQQQRVAASQPQVTYTPAAQRHVSSRGVIVDQPHRHNNMSSSRPVAGIDMPVIQNVGARQAVRDHLVHPHHQAMPARKPVIQEVRPAYHQQSAPRRKPVPAPARQATPFAQRPARMVRRDSNGVSEFGSDDEFDRDALRGYNVSPVGPSGRNGTNMHARTGYGYGQGGAF